MSKLCLSLRLWSKFYNTKEDLECLLWCNIGWPHWKWQNLRLQVPIIKAQNLLIYLLVPSTLYALSVTEKLISVILFALLGSVQQSLGCVHKQLFSIELPLKYYALELCNLENSCIHKKCGYMSYDFKKIYSGF